MFTSKCTQSPSRKKLMTFSPARNLPSLPPLRYRHLWDSPGCLAGAFSPRRRQQRSDSSWRLLLLNQPDVLAGSAGRPSTHLINRHFCRSTGALQADGRSGSQEFRKRGGPTRRRVRVKSAAAAGLGSGKRALAAICGLRRGGGRRRPRRGRGRLRRYWWRGRRCAPGCAPQT
jgi:hypothetical protein